MISISSSILSFTLARFTEEYAGRDSALVAKWNFGARGEDDTDGQFYNKGFTFDLFDSYQVKPMDFGSKSFTFTGGGSDVGIAYDVEMNGNDLLQLAADTVVGATYADIYAPFVFKITADINDGAADPEPGMFPHLSSCGDDWFRLSDIDTDEDGYFSIFDHTGDQRFFSRGSQDQVTVTVYWQWNTSCYMNDTGAASVTPNPSTEITGHYLPYYQDAYEQYYGPGGLDEQRNAAAQAVADYLEEHGSPSDDESWYTEYNQLVEAEHAAIENCETSLMTAYDDYDTAAVDALLAKDHVKVIFRITGEQIRPE